MRTFIRIVAMRLKRHVAFSAKMISRVIMLLVIVVLYHQGLADSVWINHMAVVAAKDLSPRSSAMQSTNDSARVRCTLKKLDVDRIVVAWKERMRPGRQKNALLSYLLSCGLHDVAANLMGVNNMSDNQIPLTCDGSTLPLLIGRVYWEMGKTNEALMCWKYGDGLDTYFARIGTLARQNGDELGALQWYSISEAIDNQVDFRKAAMYRDLCIIERERGNLSEALFHCRQLLEVLPNSTSFFLIGRVYLLLGQYDLALESFTTALLKDPTWYEVHSYVGLALEGLGANAMAEREYLLAIESKPDYPWAHLHLGNLYARRGEMEKAIEHLCKVMSLDDVNAARAAQATLDELKEENDNFIPYACR